MQTFWWTRSPSRRTVCPRAYEHPTGVMTMNRRSGTTLTEVLMAIFIMGIGLMALLTLFPMGALQMAQALKDQRAAEEAASAIGTFRVSWKRSFESSYRAVKFDPFDPGNPAYGNRAAPPVPSPEAPL